MNQTVKLSIIIVNYNGEGYIKNCFDSIYNLYHGIIFEIIVFDNDSKDNSISIIENNYPDVIVIKSKENLGFAKGNNSAVEKAKGEYILLLNNDTILLEGISSVFDVFEADETVGAVGIKMLDENKKYLPSFGKFPTATNLLRLANLSYNSTEFITGKFKTETVHVDWLSGAFFCTKKSYWNSVNGLDEDYFMYVEDVDFCKKLQKINKKCVFIPSVSFVHFVGFNKSREMRLIKGYFLYASKHFNTFEKTIAKACLFLNYAFKKIFKNIR